MIENLILCALFLAFIGYREFFTYKERCQLLDRIQASGLVEYKKFEEKPVKKEVEEKRKSHKWL